MQKISKNLYFDLAILITKVILIFGNAFIFIYLTLKNSETLKKRKLEKGGVALCTIAKSENLYIKEFTEHYKKLGVKNIFLYDNNDENDEKYTKILLGYIKSGFIEITNIRGKKLFQKIAFHNCLKKNKNKYDWLLFFDVDEFLYINNNQTLYNFLSEPRYKNCQTIKINWKCYGDNENLYYENNSVQKRFTKQSTSKYCNRWIKSIVNVKNNDNIGWGYRSPHVPYINVRNSCDTLGDLTYYEKKKIYPPIYKYVYLKHYATKSSEEYANKILRGDAVFLIKNNSNHQKRMLKKFFRLNNFTKEKFAIFEKKLNISLNYHEYPFLKKLK